MSAYMLVVTQEMQGGMNRKAVVAAVEEEEDQEKDHQGAVEENDATIRWKAPTVWQKGPSWFD